MGEKFRETEQIMDQTTPTSCLAKLIIHCTECAPVLCIATNTNPTVFRQF